MANSNRTNKGFTIIELIVVIAIIALLAGIVLVNVQGYINKGKDASIKADLDGLATTAASNIEQGGSVDNICSNTDFKKFIDSAHAVTSSKTYVCKDYPASPGCVGGKWAVFVQLASDDNYYCADSTGKKSIQVDALICACNPVSL